MAHRVLFLCTGNSCRSQMAEAIVNRERGAEWQAFSAGTEPSAEVHPVAIRVLAEIGIALTGATPKRVDQFYGQPFDLVITVCDDAAENCPVWLGQGQRVHVGFPDPAKATGAEGAVLAVFRTVRDDIVRQILPLLDAHAAMP